MRVFERNTSNDSQPLNNNKCYDSEDNKQGNRNILNSMCSSIFGVKTSRRRQLRSPIMVPTNFENKRNDEEFNREGRYMDMNKEPGELQDLIDVRTTPGGLLEFQKDFVDLYSRTKNQNNFHPQGYYSTPSEQLNFTGGYVVREPEENMETQIGKWEAGGGDLTGVGSEKEYKSERGNDYDEYQDGKEEDEEEGGRKEEEEEGDVKGEENNEEEVDLSHEFENEKLEPPEFRDKFFKTKPLYKHLKYPKVETNKSSSTKNKTKTIIIEEEKTKEVDKKEKKDVEKEIVKDKEVKQVSVAYKPLNEVQNGRPPPYRPYRGRGGITIIRGRIPYGRNKKVIIIKSPNFRKPKVVFKTVRNPNCDACIIPSFPPNGIRKVSTSPVYFYPPTKFHSKHMKNTLYPPYANIQHLNYKPIYHNHPVVGDPRMLNRGTVTVPPPVPRHRNNNHIQHQKPGTQFKGLTDPTSGKLPIDQGLDKNQQETKNIEVHIIRETPGGYDNTVVYQNNKYVPTELEIRGNEPYRPDPFKDVEDEYRGRIEKLNEVIDKGEEMVSKAIDKDYEYWYT